MFNQTGGQSVPLSTFGGLITEALPDSLSEGSSPQCWDVDFPIGGFITRGGLASVYGSGVNSQNFVWIQTFQQKNGQIYTLALAADGSLWREDVTNSPGTITSVASVTAGDSAFGCQAFNRMYIALSGNHDMPRQYTVQNGSQVFDRVTQVGPGMAVSPVTTNTSNPGLANLTSFSISSNVVTFIAANSFTNGEIIQITGTGISYLDGTVLTVIAAGLSSTQFEASLTHANVASTTITGQATPLTGYPVSTITQPSAVNLSGKNIQWTSAPDANGSGTNLHIYYSATQDATLTNAFTSGIPVYVYLNNMPSGIPNGTYLVTGIGKSIFSSNAHDYYFSVTMPYSNFLKVTGGASTTYQMTLATVTVSTPVPNAVVGNQVSIEGATPSAWNGSWTIVEAPNSGVFAVTQTQISSGGVATYTYTLQSGNAPATGNLVTVTNTTGGNGIFNITNGVITGTGVGTFQVTFAGFTGSAAGPFTETGQAETSGNTFMIDDGLAFVGSTNQASPIFGNDSGAGFVVVSGSNLNVAAGTRQVVVMFLTKNGFLSKPSPAATFTIPSNTSAITINNIPIGPPNTIARWIAFTEAGANGVPGAYYYVIPVPVQTVVNGQNYTYQPTVINDNITTSATFAFIDSVLLSSLEIDITGGNQFNMVELGSSGFILNYAGRMFYGLEENKIQNFNNLTFDGGYQSPSNPFPAGWTADATNGGGGSLIVSSAFGNSYYIQNTTGSTASTLGMITQSASLDSLNVPILQPNTQYSARVAAKIPSGSTTGNVVIDLVTFDNQIGYGPVLGSLTIPFSSFNSSQVSTQIGALLTSVFTTVPANLVLRVYATSIANNADVEIDRIEIYPTALPVLNTQLRASYVNAPEQCDAVTGVLGVAQTNTQPLLGGFVMYDQLYLLKKSSMFSTQDSPGSEPSGWQVQEVSNTVGTCGPYAYDVGEEWCVTACRSGLYVFFGKQPIKLSQEIFQVWEAINWNAASSIWVKNDIVNRRILVGVPMSTPNVYLPNAPTVTNPTTPNVILVLNYLGLGDVMALADGEQMHTTMFGTLMSVDMRRKWTIWQVASPFANFITRQDGISQPLFLGNSQSNGKIYQFLATQLSDDGTAINSNYTTYGWVDAAKAQQLQMLGMHRKQWNYLQIRASGSGTMTVKLLPNNLVPSAPFSKITLPGITLASNPGDDYERSVNAVGNLMFVNFSTNAVGAAMSVRHVIMVGKPATLALRGNAAQ